MWRATIRGLLAHKLRLALTALAIVLGVAFVAGTYMLTDTMNSAFEGLFQQINHGVAVDVSGVPKFTANGPGGQGAGGAERVPAALLDSIRQVPGVKAAEGTLAGYAQLVDKHGKAITTGGAPTIGVSWVYDPDLSAVTIREGKPPAAAGEIAIDRGTAQKYGFRVGDTTKVLLQGPPMQARIVGIFSFGEADNLLGATLVGFDPATAQTALDGGGRFDDIVVAAAADVSPTQLRDRIAKILPAGVQARTGTQAATANANDIKQSLKFFNIILLVFAGVALFVGAFFIFNTFSILIGQRTRELALLRALGASPGQVRRSVMIEALLVGLLASAVGLVAGFGVAVGLQGLLRGFGIDLPTTSTVILPRTIIVSMVVGVGTTWVSSVMPAIRASRVPLLAALRETAAQEYVRSRRRTIAGVLVTVAGIGALALGLFAGRGISLVGLGAALIFLGVTVLSPLAARPVTRFLGGPLPRLSGISGKLGRENAMRNPRRTASTAAALMIGLALVAFVSIFAASIKDSTNRILEETVKADYIVSTSQQQQGFSQDVANDLRSNPAFGAVEEARFGEFGYKGDAKFLVGLDPSTLEAVTDVKMLSGSLSALGDGDVLVIRTEAQSNDWRVGQTIPVEFARTGKRQLRIAGIYDNSGLMGTLGSFVITLPEYDANFTTQLDGVVLATTAPGVSQAQAKAAAAAIAKQFPNVKLEDQAQFRKTQSDQINQLLGLVIALLFMSVIIAVAGISNTLYLSVYERTREIGLLRAVGLSRRQTKRMIRWEAILIAVFGALLGTAIGSFFGWAMVRALNDQGITVFSVPTGQLVFYVVLAGIFGVIAAFFPALRASRLDVLRAIASE